MAEQTPGNTVERAKPRTQIGLVMSSSMDKTIVVKVQRLVKHRVYKKYIRRDKKLYVHDETNTANPGDKVEVVEMTRPLSKTKRYRLRKVVERAK
ncbi:30S ribosomal protein S17 [bacterium]|nr:30S ribosomal protein S17 [bacterium]